MMISFFTASGYSAAVNQPTKPPQSWATSTQLHGNGDPLLLVGCQDIRALLWSGLPWSSTQSSPNNRRMPHSCMPAEGLCTHFSIQEAGVSAENHLLSHVKGNSWQLMVANFQRALEKQQQGWEKIARGAQWPLRMNHEPDTLVQIAGGTAELQASVKWSSLVVPKSLDDL
jgi:hypothetical protein